MTVSINGHEESLDPGTTVADVVSQRTGQALADDGRPVDGSRLGIAVALDDAVVPRSLWATTPVNPGARIELVTAVQGG